MLTGWLTYATLIDFREGEADKRFSSSLIYADDNDKLPNPIDFRDYPILPLNGCCDSECIFSKSDFRKMVFGFAKFFLPGVVFDTPV